MWVIKVGGGAGNAWDPVLDELAEYWNEGRRWLLLHGGSERANQVCRDLGHPPEFVTSPRGFTWRRTDRDTLVRLAMVYAGEVN
jgi:acetylglutamate/LysW-gamma-L-alpha-aminoadipate kinase